MLRLRNLNLACYQYNQDQRAGQFPHLLYLPNKQEVVCETYTQPNVYRYQGLEGVYLDEPLNEMFGYWSKVTPNMVRYCIKHIGEVWPLF